MRTVTGSRLITGETVQANAFDPNTGRTTIVIFRDDAVHPRSFILINKKLFAEGDHKSYTVVPEAGVAFADPFLEPGDGDVAVAKKYAESVRNVSGGKRS